MDNAVLMVVGQDRIPWLTTAALDVTVLGSNILLALFSLGTVVLLVAWRANKATLQLLSAWAGTLILTPVTKDLIGRARPPLAERLAPATGFSYPSGHSLGAAAIYLTIAIICTRHIAEPRARAVILSGASLMIVIVGASRVYLGVHYLTDVLSGFALGAAWAMLLAAFFHVRHPDAIK